MEYLLADNSYICGEFIKRCIMIKIIHVHLKGKRKDYYFGSISAVFETLSAETVGVTKSYLQHAGLSGGGTVVTRTAIIKQAALIRGSRDKGFSD